MSHSTMIDAYCHCGISKYRPVGDVLATMHRCRIDRAVLVQHLGEFDNSYLAQVVEQYPNRFAAVGLVDPKGQWDRVLSELVASQRFRGVRVNCEMMGDNPRLCGEVLLHGLNLVVCIDQPMPSVFPVLHELAEMETDGKIVLSHMGGLVLDRVHSNATAIGVEFASRKSVFVNLSGMSMFCEYPYETLERFVRTLVGKFGTNRLMWGSNFPVCGDAESFCRDLHLVRVGAWGLTDDQVQRVLHNNAENVWFKQ